MTNSPQQWLTSRAAPPGMLACGVRGPDGTLVCHNVEESCPAGTLEKILRQFDTARATLFSDDLAPSWSTWAFERGQIRFVERPMAGCSACSSGPIPRLSAGSTRCPRNFLHWNSPLMRDKTAWLNRVVP